MKPDGTRNKAYCALSFQFGAHAEAIGNRVFGDYHDHVFNFGNNSTPQDNVRYIGNYVELDYPQLNPNVDMFEAKTGEGHELILGHADENGDIIDSNVIMANNGGAIEAAVEGVHYRKYIKD